MYYNSNRGKYRSITCGYARYMFLCNSSDCGSWSVLVIKNPNFLEESVKIDPFILLSKLLPNSFLENVISWIYEEKPDTLLGDFNL